MRRAILTLLLFATGGCTGTIEAPTLSCSGDGDCATGVCVDIDGAGGCVDTCSDADQCDAGTVCSLGHTIDDGVVTLCVPEFGTAPTGAPCGSSADCASGLCGESLCLELCTACDGGQACDSASIAFDGRFIDVNVCQWRHDWGAVELGPVPTPVAGSGELLFDVPAGTTSLTVILTDDDGLRVAVKSLRAPDGTHLIDLDDADADLNPGFNWPGTASTLIPSTDDPAARPQAGTYVLRVGTYDPANWTALDPLAGTIERVVVLLERQGEEGGLLDLNLHFAPATGITSDAAAEDGFVVAMLNELDAIYATQAHVRLANIQYSELPTDHDVVEDGDEVRSIVSTFSEPGLHGTAVNLFLVDDVTFTAGYSAGRPGPPGIYGTSGSGVVAELLGSGRDTGVLLAHEIGHFMGLYHSSELSGGGRDPIGDTPECPGGTAVADCPDYTNLMFPRFPLGQTLTLSDGQRRVLRGNPTFYEVDRFAACDAALTYEVGLPGFATADTTNLGSDLSGSCGGAGAPERAHLIRLDQTLTGALEVRVTGHDFAPTVYIVRGACNDSTQEFACDSADSGSEIMLSVDGANRGAWFVIVDGRDAEGGTFSLDAEVVAP